MRHFILSFLILIFINPLVFSQSHQGCNHSTSFQKSPLSDSLDVESYHIFIDSILWNTDELYARTEIVLTSKIDDLMLIPLELMSLTVTEVLINGEATSNYSQTDLRLNINLDSPLQTDESVNLSISYNGTPFHEGWGGFYIDNQYAYNLGVGFQADPHNLGKTWFPCVDDFHDRAIYDITARVEDPLVAVAGGLLQSVTDNDDGTKSYHWHLNNSIPTYLASVAVGEYALYEDVYEGIEGDVPIKIYVRPNGLGNVEGSFANLKTILSSFENSFGSYPFNRIGYVGTSIGAMEHATNIAYPNFAINGNLSYESLYAHELSHMWFGDKVTCASAEDMWLNEGWATFCQMYYKTSVYGEQLYKEDMMHQLREVLRMTHYKDNGYLALYGISHDYTYGSTVYDKGSTVVQSLRGYLGDDVFFPAIKAYLEDYAYNYASSENMRDFLTSYTGLDMTDFFDAYIFTPGFSHFSVDSVEHISGSDYAIHMRQKLKGKEVYANGNIVDVTVMDANWNQYDIRVHFDGESGSEIFTLPFEPVVAMSDLHQNFCDATTDSYQVIKETGNYNFTECYFKLEVENVPDSTFFRITHNWVAPDPLFEPIEGLSLSDYRYYKVDGIFPESFDATGVFKYSLSEKLDSGFIGNPLDSLVVLYRANASENWQAIEFEQDGSPFAGYMRVSHLQTGEYTIALWDELFVTVQDDINSNENDYMLCYPNPSTGRVNFDIFIQQESHLEIFNSSGVQIDTILLRAGQATAKWDGRRLAKGNYIVKLVGKDNEVISWEKVIIQ
ncbi:MAG: T9SS type A sorting domain-containing protein [Bacteroidales bacterium]|nr:T9SS type A sorting domain-containing protein [Bacteroidales bacterium]